VIGTVSNPAGADRLLHHHALFKSLLFSAPEPSCGRRHAEIDRLAD
jgi:hypothetical protein